MDTGVFRLVSGLVRMTRDITYVEADKSAGKRTRPLTRSRHLDQMPIENQTSPCILSLHNSVAVPYIFHPKLSMTLHE